MLHKLVAHQSARPVGLAVGTHGQVLVVVCRPRTIRAPSPDVAVLSVGSRLSGIEGTAVQHTLLIVLRPVGTRVVEAVAQSFERVGHHILHLTAPAGGESLTVDEVPPRTHLEDIGAFAHAVPNHVEASLASPVLQVRRLEVSEAILARDNHIVNPAVLENLRVAEVYSRETVVGAVEAPLAVFRPVLEVGRRGAHHHLAVRATGILACIIDVVELVLLVVDTAARAESCILLVDVGAGGKDLAERLIVTAVCRSDSPDGVEELAVVVIVLQVEHLEVSGLLVVERHGVADAAEIVLIIGRESLLGVVVDRREGRCRSSPVLLSVAGEIVVTAGCGCGDTATHKTHAEYIHHFFHHGWFISLSN